MSTVLQVAQSYVGIKESPPRSNRTVLGARYGQNGVPWCGIAVSMAFLDAGIPLRKILTTNMASTVAIMSAGKMKGWFKPARSAQPGDIVCYHMPGGRRGVNHVGIVRTVTSTGITAFEGNTSQSGSQFAGGAYLVKSRPWSVILGVVRIPFVGTQPPPYVPPAPAPAPSPLPVRPGLVYHAPGTPVSPASQGRFVEIAQWEMAAAVGADGVSRLDFGPDLAAPGRAAVFGDHTKWNLVNFGKAFGKTWDGNWIGPDQWAVIDFAYILRAKQSPVLS